MTIKCVTRQVLAVTPNGVLWVVAGFNPPPHVLEGQTRLEAEELEDLFSRRGLLVPGPLGPHWQALSMVRDPEVARVVLLGDSGAWVQFEPPPGSASKPAESSADLLTRIGVDRHVTLSYRLLKRQSGPSLLVCLPLELPSLPGWAVTTFGGEKRDNDETRDVALPLTQELPLLRIPLTRARSWKR